MNIFKWFKQDQKIIQNPDNHNSKWNKDIDIDGCIVYYVTKDGETCVDIEISDYDSHTMENFYQLISTVGQQEVFVETLEIIKEGFVAAGKEELFVKLATRVSLEVLEDAKEGPCIKPSDVL